MGREYVAYDGKRIARTLKKRDSQTYWSTITIECLQLKSSRKALSWSLLLIPTKGKKRDSHAIPSDT